MSLKTTLPIFAMTVETAVAITETQPVGFDGTVAAAAGRMIGIAQRDAENGLVPVTVTGIATATAGTAIAQGDELEIDAAGKLIPLAAGTAVAEALEAAAADGDLVSVILK